MIPGFLFLIFEALTIQDITNNAHTGFISKEKMEKYKVIYADPPWSYKAKNPTASKGGAKGSGYSAGVNYYYDTMSIEDIQNMPIKELANKDSVLFLWAVNPLLPEAFATMRTWGFKYKTTITWHKMRCKGMGYWFRGHTEFLLLGVRGKVPAFRSLQHNIIQHKVLKHSKKPSVFRETIEKVTVDLNPKIELFARDEHKGLLEGISEEVLWDKFGNQCKGSINIDMYRK